MTGIDAHINMGDKIGTNSRIDTGDTGISLVRSYNIISKYYLYEDMKTKLLGAI